ncbi:transposon Ty3-I Gag-Pol polyprotein [Trichonephila clavipes]|nr:transposon Ty3-I Gag-Pol polyprotein [Trichonephila clavipes]
MDFRFKCRNFRPAARTNYSRPNKEECTVRASGTLLDEWSTINSPAEIAEKFEEYESVRRTLRPKFYNSFAKGRYEASGSSDNYFQRTEYPRGGSNRRERKHFQLNGTSYSGKSKRLTCSYCKGPGHYAVDCNEAPQMFEN